jgi:hypothetical protein
MNDGHWNRLGLILVGALALLVRADVVVAMNPDQTIRPARERLIEGWLIAGSSEDESRRKVSTYQVGSGGWPQFVEQKSKVVYDWGIRRFWLHNPFGTLSNEVMQFDQYLDAQDAGVDVLTENFAEAWAPVVDGSFGEPIELIAYLGTADSADDRLKAAFETGRSASIVGTMLACVKPVLLAGGSIGADAAVKLSDSGPAFKFYKYLESIGIPVYVESRPKIANPKWAEFPVFAVDAWWKRSDPAQHQDCVAWALPNEAMQREVVRWIRDYDGRSTDPAVIAEVIGRIRAALLEGDTVIFRSDGLRAAGVPFEQLIAGIDEQLGVDSGSAGSAGGAGSDSATPPQDSMEDIESRAEEIVPVSGQRDAPAVTPSSGASSGGGGTASSGTASAGSGGSVGSGASTSGSIQIKPRSSTGGVRSNSGKGPSIQRVISDAETNQSWMGPIRIRSRAIRRIDVPGRSKVIRTATGKPADWVERARRSSRRIMIVNEPD